MVKIHHDKTKNMSVYYNLHFMLILTPKSFTLVLYFNSDDLSTEEIHDKVYKKGDNNSTTNKN